jgi:protease-4
MPDQIFLLELFTSILLLRGAGLGVLENLVRSAVEGTEAVESAPKAGITASYAVPYPYGSEGNPYDRFGKDSVAVIPLSGMMLKQSYYRNTYGCDELADLLRLADRSAQVSGTLLLIDTPGGTTGATIQLEDALRTRTKPCVGLIDGSCCSGGIYVASFCDELYAMNRMCEIGSIGVYCRIIDMREVEKRWGFKIEEFYPPESKYKNLKYREALEGKPERLIREELTPYAIHFQNLIKENRPKPDVSVEGILEGREFYAYDAVTNGLIDGIMNMEKAKERVHTLSESQKTFYSQFK